MLEDIKSFLAGSPVFREVPEEQMDQLAPLLRVERHAAGAQILRQGGYSQAIYFVRSGRLAVRVQRGEWRETIAFLQPPDMLGELSFLTGKPCSADVEVVVDAEVVALYKDAVPQLPEHREALLRGLMLGIADRLHTSTTQGTKVPLSPVVLLHSGTCWESGSSFPFALVESLARQSGHSSLLVRIGSFDDAEPAPVEANASVASVRAGQPGKEFRAEIAQKLTYWKSHFDNVLLDAVGPVAGVDEIGQFADIHGYLLGPGDPVPSGLKESDFIVQSAAAPTLESLSARRRLISNGVDAEKAHLSRQPLPAKFQRTVDSIARAIAGLQVGLALGGGAAWGWAHIGVLDVLEKAGIPIDAVSGCSMGSVIGALYCSGLSVDDLRQVADYWRTRTRRFIEWRFWRMTLLNEKVVRKVFRQYFGDRTVNQAEIPYWANAVDIRTGKEFTIRDGPLVDCVRASIALPGLLPPAKRDTHLLVDAGIMDPVPAYLVRDMGCHYNIAVNAMASLEKQELSTRFQFFDVMTRCMFVMGHEIGEARAQQVASVLFTPLLGEITMLQFGRSPEIIACGVEATEENLPAIKAGYDRLKQSRAAPAAKTVGAKL